jgi:hypothetical protein
MIRSIAVRIRTGTNVELRFISSPTARKLGWQVFITTTREDPQVSFTFFEEIYRTTEIIALDPHVAPTSSADW